VESEIWTVAKNGMLAECQIATSEDGRYYLAYAHIQGGRPINLDRAWVRGGISLERLTPTGCEWGFRMNNSVDILEVKSELTSMVAQITWILKE